jgi:GTP diphosphokinase / guanosine-3',5'-bis(diphosphate) 3'-diphosphatase
MTLPKEERRRLRIEGAAHKSRKARIVKTADAISNLRCMAESPPAGWPLGWRLRYVDGMRAMHDRMRGASPALDELLDTQEADSRAALTAMGNDRGV